MGRIKPGERRHCLVRIAENKGSQWHKREQQDRGLKARKKKCASVVKERDWSVVKCSLIQCRLGVSAKASGADIHQGRIQAAWSFLKNCQGASCLCLNCLTPSLPLCSLSLPPRHPPPSLQSFLCLRKAFNYPPRDRKLQ